MKSFLQTGLALALLLLAILLAACNGTPNVQPAVLSTLSPTKPVPSHTSIPFEPTRTLQPSVTVSVAATATMQPTPTLLDDISQVRLAAHGVLPNWNYLFTFGFAEKVQGSYKLMVDQNKEYTCTTRSDQPLYLYCDGPMAAFDDYVEYVLSTEDGSQLVKTGQVFIPAEFTP